ncbi:unnamed protein product, partial [Trichobilharzia regenti]
MSRIFDPYRVLGLCSSDVPFVVKYIPNSEAYYAVVPTGERFNLYKGALQLWNIVSQKLLHWFRGFDASVTCLQQAPAIDVCAVGLADGRIIIHNLKYDVTLMKFAQDCGAITSIGFRSGSHGLQKPSNIDENSCVTLLPSQNNDVYLVSGCETGYINCWELKEDGKSRSVGQARNLHCGSVITIYCIPGGDAASAMVTSGSDNCIKVSYFDRPDGGPR